MKLGLQELEKSQLTAMSREHDNFKRVQDSLAEFRAKGLDVTEVTPIMPGGISESIRYIKNNFSQVKDQAQEQQRKRR